MVYHQVLLNPTEGQMSDLSSGEEVKLQHKHIAGDVMFHLTTAQLKKIEKAHAMGKACTLKFSAAQLKHMMQNGSGRFRDLLGEAYDAIKPTLAKGVDSALTYAKDRAVDKINHMVGFKQKGKGFFGDAAKWLGHTAVDGAVGALGGSVKPKRTKQAGKGWLGDAAEWLGHTAVDGAVGALGGGLNPMHNNNELLRSALFEKKARGASGSGLYQ
jgi:hypothetical protein